MARIELKGVRKSFQNMEVIHGVDLDIEDGAFTVFVGPSGCGKSTLLRMMAGLEELSAGEVHIDGTRCDHLMPAARGMAMVFQSYALYPHMSVEQNLRFGLENARMAKKEIDARVARAADILRISELMKRRPNQLSGGQSQRVAIGRAIVKEPKAFLFDEPLSNLDAELRVKMRAELIALHQRLRATMIYVTHDQVEAMTMADRIVVLRDGRIEQVGSPIELYARPANTFVAGFLGAPQMNFLPATISAVSADTVTAALSGEGGSIALGDRTANGLATGSKASIGIRPEHLKLDPAGPLNVTIDTVERLGAESIVHGQLSTGTPVSASLRGITGLAQGGTVRFSFSPNLAHLFTAEGTTVPSTRNWELDYRLE